jgi:hypothetical protein
MTILTAAEPRSEPATDRTAVRPFRVDVQEAELTELRVETVYPGLAYFNEVDRGGHFAAWEEPELFSTEVRATFSSLRQ